MDEYEFYLGVNPFVVVILLGLVVARYAFGLDVSWWVGPCIVLAALEFGWARVDPGDGRKEVHP